jgi:Tol biopolymer transport system component/DNA-binding winged helix-turn-helix (wHTH) protein
MSKETKLFYEFDLFRLDVTERVLMCEGEMVPLTQKAFEVLLVLVERRGRIVGKEELMEKVWPDTFVEESNLAQNIYTLRKVLGQTPAGDGYIVTVPRRGYRFAAAVRELWEEEKAEAETASATPEPEVQVQTDKAAAESIPVSKEGPSIASPEVSPETTALSPPVPVTGGVRPSWIGYPNAMVVIAAVTLLAALGVAWAVSRSGRRSEAISGKMNISALTTSGNITTAAISPDGAYVAYATTDTTDRSTLWIEQRSTSERRAVLPANENHYYALTFSPDAGHLYYVAATNDSPRRSVYRVSVLGGNPKKMFDEVNTAVSFSPDGSQLVLRRAIDTRRVITLSIANPNGGEEKEIASIRYPGVFYDPAWSPDGKMIAAAAGNPSGVAEMYVAGIQLGMGQAGDWTMKPISSRRWRWVGQMDWLPDSSGLVMVAQETSASPRQVWLLKYPSGEAHRITNDTSIYNRLSLAADPGLIAALQVKQVSNVWLIPGDGGGRGRQITVAAGGYRGEISWTPDGKLVYDSEAGSAPAISVMDAEGGNTKLLTGEFAGRAYVGLSRVSPDGRYIVFVSDLKGERHLWRMNMDGSNPVQLTNGSGEHNPAFTPDGRWVLYANLERAGTDRPTIGRVSIDGGEMKRLNDDFTDFPSVSPDGKSFACLYAEGPGPIPYKIAIFPIEGGQPVKIFTRPVQPQTIRWTPDGRGLTYADNPVTGTSKIMIQPVAGGEPKVFAEMDADRIFGLDWSRDGKFLASVRGLWTTNVVLIKNFTRD